MFAQAQLSRQVARTMSGRDRELMLEIADSKEQLAELASAGVNAPN